MNNTVDIVFTRKPRKNWKMFQGRYKYFSVVDIKRYKRMSIFAYMHQIRWERGLRYSRTHQTVVAGRFWFRRKRKKMIGNDNMSMHYYNMMK